MVFVAMRHDAAMRWINSQSTTRSTPVRQRSRACVSGARPGLGICVATATLWLVAATSHARTLEEDVRAIAQAQWASPQAQSNDTAHEPLRFSVDVGALDARLRLAPCERIEPQWPAGVRPWGLVRVALRCVQGPTPWKVYLPVRVKALARVPVLTAPLAAGATVGAQHLGHADVDVAATRDIPFRDPALLIGRSLSRPLPAGSAIQPGDLHRRQWFAMGDTVRVDAVGDGFRVAAEGEALTPGIEGQPSRVRMASGRVVTGRAIGERQFEVTP